MSTTKTEFDSNFMYVLKSLKQEHMYLKKKKKVYKMVQGRKGDSHSQIHH